jgi:hypothetical protein
LHGNQKELSLSENEHGQFDSCVITLPSCSKFSVKEGHEEEEEEEERNVDVLGGIKKCIALRVHRPYIIRNFLSLK